MSSPYGWGATPPQSPNNGVPEPAPSPHSGYSQQSPSYGFNNQPQYGFGAQPQPSQPPQGAPQYGFGVQQPQGQQYQQGINNQPLYMGNYPSMQGQFDSNNEYNIKAVLGFIFVFLFWPVGLVLAILGRNEINKNGGRGKGLTTASFVLCGIDIVVAIVFTVMVFTGALDYPVAYDEPLQGYSYSQDSAYHGDSAPAILQNENNKVIPDQTHERNN